jgi:hypothetical protein
LLSPDEEQELAAEEASYDGYIIDSFEGEADSDVS